MKKQLKVAVGKFVLPDLKDCVGPPTGSPAKQICCSIWGSLQIQNSCSSWQLWLGDLCTVSSSAPVVLISGSGDSGQSLMSQSSTDWTPCNELYIQLPLKSIWNLQLVLNVAEWAISRRAHIILLVHELHWLPACFQIQFKVLFLTFKALNGMELGSSEGLPNYNSHVADTKSGQLHIC